MNKKGQTMGSIIMVFVAVVVGISLFLIISQTVGQSTSTVELANQSFTSAAEGASAFLTDYRLIGSPVIYNATGALVPAANYTLTNNVVNNGALAVEVATGAQNEWATDVWNISGTAQKTDYIDSSAARSIALLISIFFALAIAVVPLEPTLRSGVLSMMGK